MRGVRCQSHDVVAQTDIPTDGKWGLAGYRIQMLQTAGKEGVSNKMESIVVNRIYYRQLGLLGGAIHEASIVYLGAD
jgi:hypothetical protein